MSHPQRTSGYTSAPRGYTPVGNRPPPPMHRQQPPPINDARRQQNWQSSDVRGPMHSEIRGERRRSRDYLYQQHPQHAVRNPHGNVTVGRSRSLTRPERQRPRPGLIRTPSRTRPPQAHPMIMPPRMQNQPMSNRLQQQLLEQKMAQQQQQQQTALPSHPIEEEKQEKPKVLTSWWAWTAFLVTCCIPNWFIRVCLRKPNPMMQQAWREKVKDKNKYWTKKAWPFLLYSAKIDLISF